MKEYYIVADEKQKGPFTISQIKALWDRAEITSDTLYSSKGMDGWRPLLELMEEHEEPPSADNEQPLPDRTTEDLSDIPPEDDEVLFTEDSYTVTTSRFVTPEETYAIRNITSVSHLKSVPNYWLTLSVICALGLFIYLFMQLGSDRLSDRIYSLRYGWVVFFVVTVIGGCIGYIIYALRRPTFAVCLTTTAGEVSALESKDEEYTSKIVSALNKAIAQY